jgi:hypothetical protein
MLRISTEMLRISTETQGGTEVLRIKEEINRNRENNSAIWP